MALYIHNQNGVFMNLNQNLFQKQKKNLKMISTSQIKLVRGSFLVFGFHAHTLFSRFFQRPEEERFKKPL